MTTKKAKWYDEKDDAATRRYKKIRATKVYPKYPRRKKVDKKAVLKSKAQKYSHPGEPDIKYPIANNKYKVGK